MRYDNLILRLVLISFFASNALLGQSQLRKLSHVSAAETVNQIFANQVVRSGPSPNTKCGSNNPFIKHLFNHGVDLHSEPTTASLLIQTSCQKEWPKYGSCCERVSLYRYAKKDQSDIMTAASIVEKKFEEFLEVTRPLYNIIVTLKSIKSDNVFVGFIKNILSRFDEKNLFYFGKLMESKELGATFRVNNQRCWKKIIAVRKSSLCQTCSGRSSGFFDGERIKISLNLCTDILSDCASAFEQIANLLKILGILAEDFRVSGILEKSHGSSQEFKLVSELAASIKEQHLTRKAGEFTAAIEAQRLKKEFKKTASNRLESVEKKNFDQKKKEIEQKLVGLSQSSYLCDRFLQLSKLPFIWDVASHFDIDLNIFSELIELYKQVDVRLQAWGSSQPSNWSHLKARVLLLSHMTSVSSASSNRVFANIFTGDVKTIDEVSDFVLNFDGML